MVVDDVGDQCEEDEEDGAAREADGDDRVDAQGAGALCKVKRDVDMLLYIH